MAKIINNCHECKFELHPLENSLTYHKECGEVFEVTIICPECESENAMTPLHFEEWEASYTEANEEEEEQVTSEYTKANEEEEEQVTSEYTMSNEAAEQRPHYFMIDQADYEGMSPFEKATLRQLESANVNLTALKFAWDPQTYNINDLPLPQLVGRPGNRKLTQQEKVSYLFGVIDALRHMNLTGNEVLAQMGIPKTECIVCEKIVPVGITTNKEEKYVCLDCFRQEEEKRQEEEQKARREMELEMLKRTQKEAGQGEEE